MFACDQVDVQFQGVRSGLFDDPGIQGPTSWRRSVETGDHRDRQCLFGGSQAIEVVGGAGVVVVHLREVSAGGFCRYLRAEVEGGMDRHCLVLDLLLEQRRHHDGTGSGRLEALHGLNRAREGRSRRDDRVGEIQTEIARGQVHSSSSSSKTAARWTSTICS
jgi:hypothetical protein